MNFLKFAVLSVTLAAFTACGGGSKKDDTTPDKTNPCATENPCATAKDNPCATPKNPCTAGAKEPTCENAVAHGMTIMVKAGMATQEQADAAKDKAIAKCKSENPPKSALECVLKSTTPQAIAACDPKKKDGSSSGEEGKSPEPKGR